eukprot:284818839_6
MTIVDGKSDIILNIYIYIYICRICGSLDQNPSVTVLHTIQPRQHFEVFSVPKHTVDFHERKRNICAWIEAQRKQDRKVCDYEKPARKCFRNTSLKPLLAYHAAYPADTILSLPTCRWIAQPLERRKSQKRRKRQCNIIYLFKKPNLTTAPSLTGTKPRQCLHATTPVFHSLAAGRIDEQESRRLAHSQCIAMRMSCQILRKCECEVATTAAVIFNSLNCCDAAANSRPVMPVKRSVWFLLRSRIYNAFDTSRPRGGPFCEVLFPS